VAINNKKITDIVGENYVFASVLYYFGIRFYDYSEKTLEQVCEEKGLNIQAVITSLESVCEEKENMDITLFSYPIDLIIDCPVGRNT
jgi:regulator of cell morphogenesis and NO signaling